MKRFFYDYLCKLAFEDNTQARDMYTNHILVQDDAPTQDEFKSFNEEFSTRLQKSADNIFKNGTIHIPLQMLIDTVAHCILSDYDNKNAKF